MKLVQLLEGLEYQLYAGGQFLTEAGRESAEAGLKSGEMAACAGKAAAALETRVTDITNDSRKAVPGGLFFAIRGANSDGHTYAVQVTAAGAAVLVVEHTVDVDGPLQVVVPSTRRAMALISAAFYGHPARRLKMIGITGTKGKTTTTYLVRSILERAGIDTGLIGTIEMTYHDVHRPAANTTPESIALHKDFKEMADAGVQAVVMEVSSQALMLDRTAGIQYDIGVFTNLSEDHIGPNEHKDFEDYLHCKSLLFRQCRVGIVNGDDPYVDRILEGSTCTVERFGVKYPAMAGAEAGTPCALGGPRGAEAGNPGLEETEMFDGADRSDAARRANDLCAVNAELIHKPGELGIRFDAEGLIDLPGCEVATPGRFSIYNAMAAVAICRHFDVQPDEIRKALRGAKTKGRIELVKVSDSFTLMIDYAHNAVALESLLTTLREYGPHRLVTLFGCGGNRAKSRRYEMGEVSGRLSDFTIITSDNPRFEDPMDIIADIVTGISKTDGAYITIPDRKDAIRYAIHHGEPGDIIVLAGKGHEDYQEICGKKYPMDERVLIREILKEDAAGQ